jgi:phage-related protein
MPNVSLDYAEIERVSAQLNSAVQNINPQLQQLKTSVDGLLSSGLVFQQTSPAMQGAYHKFTTSLTAAVQNIESFAKQFTNIRNQIEAMDKQMAKSINEAG